MPLVTRTTTNGKIFNQLLEPGTWLNGDLWSDVTSNPPVLNINDDGSALPI